MGLMLLGEAASTTTLDFSAFVTALTNLINPTMTLTVISAIVGAGMGFVLMWFGIRKAINCFGSALFKGKLRV